jgi:hypothetical protein
MVPQFHHLGVGGANRSRKNDGKTRFGLRLGMPLIKTSRNLFLLRVEGQNYPFPP